MEEKATLCDSAHEKQQAEKLLGNRVSCDDAYISMERRQKYRVELLDTLLNKTRGIVMKYLWLIDTDDEDCIDELLSDDLIDLTENKKMSYLQANSIIDVCGLVLYKMGEDIRDLRDIDGLAQQWQNG